MARRSTKTVTTNVSEVNKTVKENPEITNDTMVICRNGTAGTLIYKSSINPGYEVEWNGLGDPQELEYRELVAMRGNQRRFFEENWILIDDKNVIKKLGVDRYYKNSLTTDDFDDVFSMSPDKIKETVPGLPGGTKDAIIVTAKNKINDGTLDSRGVIKALEDSLSVDLEEDI